ncbi:MAG: Cna B-type domain-containing protein, partial [Eubacterium sp.]|nr:Cna B-type domain-containing protein [Eubacterium sp.]
VTKKWKDEKDKDGSRPNQVKIRLYANGKNTGKSLVLKKSGNWKGSFKNLDVYEDGELISYTIKEDPVKGYSAAIRGDQDTGFTVTNTHKPKNSGSPDTGDSSNFILYGGLLIAASAALIILVRRKRRER